MQPNEFQTQPGRPGAHVLTRLFSRRGGAMLLRNSIVSCTVFAVGLLVLWLLVEQFHVSQLIALAISLLCSNSLHYALGRAWVFPGSQRAVAAGYVYFLINAGIGMVATMALFALLTRYTTINYLVVRVVVSLAAGLLTFLLNAVVNFREL
jgi:putative flippase GtrA